MGDFITIADMENDNIKTDNSASVDNTSIALANSKESSDIGFPKDCGKKTAELIAQEKEKNSKPKRSRSRSNNSKRHGPVKPITIETADGDLKFKREYNKALLTEDFYFRRVPNSANNLVPDNHMILVLRNTFAVRTTFDSAMYYYLNTICQHMAKHHRIVGIDIFNHMYELSADVDFIDNSTRRRNPITNEERIDYLYGIEAKLKNVMRLFRMLLAIEAITPVQYNTMIIQLSDVYTKVYNYANNITNSVGDATE